MIEQPNKELKGKVNDMLNSAQTEWLAEQKAKQNYNNKESQYPRMLNSPLCKKTFEDLKARTDNLPITHADLIPCKSHILDLVFDFVKKLDNQAKSGKDYNMHSYIRYMHNSFLDWFSIQIDNLKQKRQQNILTKFGRDVPGMSDKLSFEEISQLKLPRKIMSFQDWQNKQG